MPAKSIVDIYSNGKSEEIVGKALKQFNIPRSRVVILTKCFFGVDEEETRLVTHDGPITINDGPWVNCVGLSCKHIFDAVDASVRRDVLQIHRLDRETPREEIMRALNDVVESGKLDGSMGIPKAPKYSNPQRLAPICWREKKSVK
ncbi:hypothetical protein Egran_00951 [Elaphomyces granulatus]|uniref:NADP-dependent oxidoreductase domain-containing protein n=1 Tax=Elaphomyces granulatus TaxID=519963 RepID=A0A232M4M3_9EURO|nr:hypothetical protein Egran_00951 [Elaphomyces granulatus]